MAKFTCPRCKFTYWAVPEKRCTSCGYHFDYVDAPLSELLKNPELVQMRTFIFAIIEPDNIKKGIHAEVTLTNRGLQLTVTDKFEHGLFTNKKWTLKQPLVTLVPYDDITAIEKLPYRGKPAGFYTYQTGSQGTLRLVCVDGGASSSINVSEEFKNTVEEFQRLLKQG